MTPGSCCEQTQLAADWDYGPLTGRVERKGGLLLTVLLGWLACAHLCIYSNTPKSRPQPCGGVYGARTPRAGLV